MDNMINIINITECYIWKLLRDLILRVLITRKKTVFFKLFFLKIYLLIDWLLCWVFVSVLGLSLVVASRGHSSSRCTGLSLSWPLVAERRLSNCGSQAQLLHGMWDPPRPGLEPMSPALAGRFSTTAPPGKPKKKNFFKFNFVSMWIHIDVCSLNLCDNPFMLYVSQIIMLYALNLYSTYTIMSQ